MKEKLIKSRDRVRNHAEVYTAEREVSAMLDLVKAETENIESRFLEPACGTGNFLVAVLTRKLSIVCHTYKQQADFERYAFVAVASIYGVDILWDNVLDCRARLLDIVTQKYTELYGNKSNDIFLQSIEYVLSKNILWGDALTLNTVQDSDIPITFCEWALVGDNRVKRRDYTMSNLLAYQTMDEQDGQMALFSSDTGEDVMIPNPIKEYPTCHYWEVPHAE